MFNHRIGHPDLTRTSLTAISWRESGPIERTFLKRDFEWHRFASILAPPIIPLVQPHLQREGEFPAEAWPELAAVAPEEQRIAAAA